MLSQGPTLPPDFRVLMIEDDAVFEQMVAQAVARLGQPSLLRCCRSGAEALEVLDDPSARFDLVLADLGLPDMSGIEVIRAARRRFAEIPIMVVSGMSDERTVLAAIRAGARGYVLKDDSEVAIARAIDHVIQGNYPISPALARHLFRLVGAPADAPADEQVRLSAKETETLQHIARGLSYAEAAQAMGVALSTVQSHIRNLYRKLEVHSQMQAVTKARDRGLI